MEITKELEKEIKLRLRNRIDCLNDTTFVDLWNNYANEMDKDFICLNNSLSINKGFVQHKVTDAFADIDCFALLNAQSENLWHKEDKYAIIKNNSIVSLNAEDLSKNPNIDVEKLVDWLYTFEMTTIKIKYSVYDENLVLKEFFGVRAYTFISTSIRNENEEYSVETKEFEGMPLFNVREWDFKLLLRMKIGDVNNRDGYVGNLVVRAK